MDAGFLGFLGAVFLLGAGAIVGLWWTGRLRDRAETARLTQPPDRQIPGFAPDEPAPRYLSELESRETPEGAVSTDLTDDERDHVERWLTSSHQVSAGYVLGDFATDRATGYAVLTSPVVAVFERLTAVRELASVFARLEGRALVVVAQEFGGDVVETLRANHTRRLMRTVAVLASNDQALEIATATGTDIISVADAQSGWLPGLGRCDRWVSRADSSWFTSTAVDS